MNNRYWQVFLVILTSSLKVSAEISGHQGGQAVLLCTAKETPISLADVIIYWFFRDDTTVHIFRKGKDVLSEQNPLFKNRTQMFKNEIVKGNFSLVLSDLRIIDSGEYTCTVPGKQTTKVQLKVIEEKKHDASPEPELTTERGKESNERKGGTVYLYVVIPLLIVAVLIGISVLYYVKRRKGGGEAIQNN